MTVPVVTTARLVLRGWTDADRPPFADLCGDPVVMEHFPATLTPEQSDEFVDRICQRWDEDRHGLWAVERRDTREFIGFIGLTAPRFETAFTPCVEVGWRLAHRHWGHGFAPEGAAAALDWGFTNLDLPDDEIVSFTASTNTNSQRVMVKIGLEPDPSRDFDHPLLADGPLRRHVLYRITRGRWAEMAR